MLVAEEAIERFLGLTMRVTREPGIKVTQRREIEVEAEVRGFNRAQVVMRQILEEAQETENEIESDEDERREREAEAGVCD